MNLSLWQEILLGIYATIQVIAAWISVTESDGRRAKAILNNYFVSPYRDGIHVGDVLMAIFFLPCIILVLVLFGTAPFFLDVLCYVSEIRLTKPRPRK